MLVFHCWLVGRKTPSVTLDGAASSEPPQPFELPKPGPVRVTELFSVTISAWACGPATASHAAARQTVLNFKEVPRLKDVTSRLGPHRPGQTTQGASAAAG